MRPARPALVLLVVLAAAPLGCRIHAGDSFDFSDRVTVRAERSQPLELAAGDTLRVDDVSGDVRVEVRDGAAPRVDASFTALGRDDAAAHSLLDRSALAVERAGRVLHLHVTVEPAAAPEPFLTPRTPHVDVVLTVPRDLVLEVATTYGDVRAAGPFGAVRVEARHGAIHVDDAAGVVAESENGAIELRSIRGDVRATTRYDGISLADADAAQVALTTTNGALRLHDVHADRIKLVTRYDDIRVERSGGHGAPFEFRAETTNGDVRVDGDADRSNGTWHLETTYGAIVARRLAGTIEAVTKNHSIHLDECRGEVTARTNYDSIHLDGVFDAVDAETKSGAIDVHAQPGSRVVRPWRLVTAYDDVVLKLPPDLSAALVAKTSYGRVACDFPADHRDGDDDHPQVTALLGAGGASIRIETKNGDVKVRRDG